MVETLLTSGDRLDRHVKIESLVSSTILFKLNWVTSFVGWGTKIKPSTTYVIELGKSSKVMLNTLNQKLTSTLVTLEKCLEVESITKLLNGNRNKTDDVFKHFNLKWSVFLNTF